MPDLYLRERESIKSKLPVNCFVEFYLDNNNAQALIEEVGYVALPVQACDTAMAKFNNRELGTVFQGPEVGIGIEELMSPRGQVVHTVSG